MTTFDRQAIASRVEALFKTIERLKQMQCETRAAEVSRDALLRLNETLIHELLKETSDAS